MKLFKKRPNFVIRVTLYVSLVSFGIPFGVGLLKSSYENFAVTLLQHAPFPHQGSYSLISPWAWLHRTSNQSTDLQNMVNEHLGNYQGHELLSWTIDHRQLIRGSFPIEFLFRVRHSKGESIERFAIEGYFNPTVSFRQVHIYK